MKRILVGFFAVSLMIVVSMPALAVDVKITGKAEMAGYWESNRAMAASDEKAMKYYTTFIRLDPVFNIAEGLRLVTRFEGMERVAGLAAVGSETANGSRNSANEQNFAMKRAYISAKVLGGKWDVGNMVTGLWGTDFLDYEKEIFRIKATYGFGPVTLMALTQKASENSLGTTTYSSSDYDQYALAGIYKWTNGEAGYLQYYIVNNTGEQAATNPYRGKFYLGSPYFKATFGPLYAEGEIDYLWGKKYDYLNTATQSIDYNSFSWYLKAKYQLGPAYIGAQVATVAGDNPDTADKDESAMQTGAYGGYSNYQPVLVLWNDWTSRFTGKNWGTNTGSNVGTGGIPQNVRLYQVFGGFKPLAKLDLAAAFTMMWADQTPKASGVKYVSDKYGNELDLSATYKFYDNLAYTVAFGYLWAGDYWKGTSDANTVGNDWLLMHKLTLNF